MTKTFSLALASIFALTVIGCSQETAEGQKPCDEQGTTVIVVNPPVDQIPTVVVPVRQPTDNGPVTPPPPSNKGRLEVDLAPTTPASTTVIGGKNGMVPFTTYRVVNTGTIAMPLRRIGVRQPFNSNGYPADYAGVGWSINGCSGAGIGMSDAYRTDFDTAYCQIVVPPGSSATITLSAQLANVVPTSAALWGQAAHSGHTPSLEIDMVETDGEVIIGAEHAPKMVLRKSRLDIVQQPSVAALTDGDRDLISFKASADDSGDVSWKQLRLHIGKSVGVSLSDLRLRRGDVDIDSRIVAITSYTGADLMTNGIDAGSQDTYLAVSFREGQEEWISGGTSRTYTLHALVSGSSAGDFVYLNGEYQEAAQPVTAALASSVAGLFVPNPNVFSVGPSESTLIWSDCSDVPHGASTGSSADWANDALLGNAQLRQTHSR